MSGVFPFDLPGATAFYVVLYLGTLIAHVVFMNYVLAGTIWVGVAALRTGADPRRRRPTVRLLRDWMPFALSAAVTAGVAPLLFVQILYRTSFYTANLLQPARWMAILPALIIGFYGMYVLKSRRHDGWPRGVRIAVALLIPACVLFTASAWTENHVLALGSTDTWTAALRDGRASWWTWAIPARLALWTVGAFPTLAALLAWQLVATAGPWSDDDVRTDARRLALAAIITLVAGAGLLVVNGALLDAGVRADVLGAPGRAWIVVAGVGGLGQIGAWWRCRRTGELGRGMLVATSLGVLLTLTGVACLREVVRLSVMDDEALRMLHERAAAIGGFGAFASFLLVNAALMAWATWLVVRHRVASDRAS